MLAGLGTMASLQVLDRSYDRQLETTARAPATARRIETFAERVAGIETIADFVADYDVYSFVMSAFDLEDQIFGKAMIRNLLQSDISDPGALVNRLTDNRFREMYQELGFDPETGRTSNTLDPGWQARMIDRFVERALINGQQADNADLGAVLEFRLRAPQVDSWYDVTRDRDLSRVLRTALGLPESMARLDLDRQIEIYETRMNLSDFADPDWRAATERRFAAIADAQAALGAPQTSPIVQLLQSRASFTPVTLDISAISTLRPRLY